MADANSCGCGYRMEKKIIGYNENIDIVQVLGPDKGSATRNEADPLHILYGRGHASVPMKRDEGHATSSHDEIYGP